jgi:mannose-6-phosphate isomerase-like protein (cupin superfamily)
MPDFTVVNFMRDVQDMAPQFGFTGMEARFGRKHLEMEKGGVSYFRIEPDYKMPFGHTHSEQEEVYVVVSGSALAKIGHQEIELAQWDAIRMTPGVWRSLAGGPEGAEVIAFGAPDTNNGDVEMQQDFWK